MPERTRAMLPDTVGVRAAVADSVIHAPNRLQIGRSTRIIRQKAADSAHWASLGKCRQCIY